MAKTEDKIKKYLSPALLNQAGVAVGLAYLFLERSFTIIYEPFTPRKVADKDIKIVITIFKIVS